jgi:heme/copper-type cytochrome/quinol oxidase subunit 2
VAGPLAETLFWILVVAAGVAHAFILRSTLRGMTASDPRARGVWEWVWAVLPAVSLIVLFVWTWYVMHPGSLTVTLPELRIAPGGISS